MGYRSTFVSEHVYITLPDWFIDKWKESVNFQLRPGGLYGGGEGDTTLPISSKYERKFYSGAEDELFLDLARVLREHKEKQYIKNLNIVLLHEDGCIDNVVIEPTKIILQRSLRYDPDDDYNPQLGNSEEYLIKLDI